MPPIRKLLVANRSEIAIRVFRTAHELGIRTVAIYSHEDRYALHRFKADEAYLVGQPGEPIRAYLNIEAILDIARQYEVDAIHPGYGFLSENPALARACTAAGITFCGPRPEVLERLGDKIAARALATEAGVPVLAGSSEPLAGAKAAGKLADKLGYPVLLKAAHGGGGRGMRVVNTPDELAPALEQAQRESQAAFGSSDVFLEKFIPRPRHIEVQLIGDKHGHLVHLFERDCSVQRRYQKVVEIAPALNLDETLRDQICQAALKIGRRVSYESAGTVEFLVDSDTGKFFFIEVNPRIQVEHTVTEVVTGVDIVKCQILVAQGIALDDPQIGLESQESIRTYGCALQCRVTTEDAENRFLPDYGRIAHYRSSGGLGVRLDAGTAFSGAVVTPYYDSLLVKVTAWARRFEDAARRMERALQEFRIRGVKTNIPFLLNLVTHPKFIAGGFTTRFIDDTPELFEFKARQDRATRLFSYLAGVIVNGHPQVKTAPPTVRREPAPIPKVDHDKPVPPGSRSKLLELGPEEFCRWIKKEKRLLITDTTLRDAHQSLLATRVRTHDMVAIADAYARLTPQMFSLEMWGGATFDTAMRFLKEDPWQRLADLRERIPNILFQMLFRASNALGYSNYPDNVVKAFVHEAAAAGMDLFRIFDSLNWVPNMRVAMDAVLAAGGLCEAAICYTGDILDEQRTKYDLKYYVGLAKELESMGAHILCIKDMAGLCKPYAAEKLIKTLKGEIGIPIHFHTHDTSGVQAGAVIKAAEAGVDIADLALASMSGLTSQPNLNSVVEALRRAARHAARFRQLAGARPILAGRAAVLLALRDRHDGQHRRRLPERNSRRTVHQPVRAGQGCRTGQPLARHLPHVCRGQPNARRHRQGDAVVQGRRRHGLIHDFQSTDASRRARQQARVGLSGIDRRPGIRPHGTTPRRFPGQGPRPHPARPKAAPRPARRQLAAGRFQTGFSRSRSQNGTRASETRRDLVPDVSQSHDRVRGPSAKVFRHQHPAHAAVLLRPTARSRSGRRHRARQDADHQIPGRRRSASRRPADRVLRAQRPAAEHQCQGPVPRIDRRGASQGRSSRPGADRRTDARHDRHRRRAQGDTVSAGQKLLTLEAMKMETTIYAERDGKVSAVLVSPGTQVDANDLLLRLE